ncbi:MAG TPA: hypothetical protein VHD63_01660 [Ktedonobacteraceae bacterium]|nr:hypothetical protein [Ktedonobacteraceae bacterium]
MVVKRRLFASLASLLLLVLLAACGNSASTGTASSPTATPVPTSQPTPTPASSSSAVVQTASATVGGKSETILTDTKGMALYYRSNDTATSVCSGGCAQAWPPLLFSGSGTPTSSSPLPGTLSVVQNVNGMQVTYQGHPLYTFASDTSAGQVSGQNVGGVWFVATPDLQAVGSGSGGAQPTPTSTYSGY